MKRYILIIILVLITLLIAKIYYDTNTIEIKHYNINNSPLGEILQGFKIAHLSDLHIKQIGLREKKVLQILKREKPDLILLTGDYINFSGSYEPVKSFFKQLQAPLGEYAVMGNTEYYNENGSCILCHEENLKSFKKTPPFFLRNSSEIMKIKGNNLTVIGVDDPVKKKADLTTALREVNKEQPCILLSHSPEIFEEASSKGVDLVLAGHTHGGQIIGVMALQKFFPLEPAMDMMEGFFQKGKTLMYVTRGIGTSFLPFRLGVKPEVTFFQFFGKKGEEGEGQVISKITPATNFSGFSFSNFVDTFNLFPVLFNKSRIDQTDQTDRKDQKVLFDFESEQELQNLNWECHKWFELSPENATSGRYCLKGSLPPGQYPGINFKNFRDDWSGFKVFKMDVFNPSKESIRFHIRIDDHKSGWEYADRFDKTFILAHGMNNLKISLETLKTNLKPRPLNLKKIERMMVFIPGNQKKRELFVDNIRLE